MPARNSLGEEAWWSAQARGSRRTAQRPRIRCLVLQEPRLGDAPGVILATVARVIVELRLEALGREVVPRAALDSAAARTLTPSNSRGETVEVCCGAKVCDPDCSANRRRDEDVFGFQICRSALVRAGELYTLTPVCRVLPVQKRQPLRELSRDRPDLESRKRSRRFE